MDAFVKKGSLHGALKLPASKSGTIRGVLFGMLADGTTVLHNPLCSRDGRAALHAARAFGAEITEDAENNAWIIKGTNNRPKVPQQVVDTETSGTTTSFAIGIAALLREGYAVISGDAQIRRRPWREETNALIELGATCIHTRPDSDCPPILVHGPIHGGVCRLSGFNSQHISGILAPCALLPAGETVEIFVEDPLEALYVQLAIDWLKKFGVEVEASTDFKHYLVRGGQKFQAAECRVASDWSSCAFPLVAAVCTDSELTITDVDFTDAQGDKAIVDILIEMGADITKDVAANRLIIRGGKSLSGIDIDMSWIPDALPALSVAAAFADGVTHFTNIAHARVKETDRVAVMHEVLAACGADVEIAENSMTVHGGKPLHGTCVSSHDDHRVAMAMTVCGLIADGEMRVEHAECAFETFPHFYETMNSVGAGIELRG